MSVSFEKVIAAQFNLLGFKEETGFRVFAFECVAADRTKTQYTVRADLALLRHYGIRIQEMPLLCRELLPRGGEGDQNCAVIFTENEMRLYVNGCADARNAAIHKRKSVRRPLSNQPGVGWRAPQA